ncbi:MAG TPA: hypothetical protein VFZ32_19290 [Micromonosporaceae bacterium]
MDSDPGPRLAERRDLLVWLVLAAVGIAVSCLALALDARVGTDSAPFLGRYAVRLSSAVLLPAVVAASVLLLAWRGVVERLPWNGVLALGYLASLCWVLGLALTDGVAGLTEPLRHPDGAWPAVADVGDDPYRWLVSFTSGTGDLSSHNRRRPPGATLLLWSLNRLGFDHDLALGLLVTAAGVATVPLVLQAVRNACGEVTARRYLPVLALAPYALWLNHPDVLTAPLGAAMIVAGAWATRHRGWLAVVGGLGSGVLLGVAAMFSYAAAWLGLSVICLYFARRRPLLNVLTGIGVLAPVLLAQALGFNWVEGLVTAQLDYAQRVEPHRTGAWWAALSLAALLLATGPAVVASLRKLRNTPAWPVLVGAGVAVLFSVLAGFARGGVEHAWLAFFPWLTVAAVAPQRQAGPPVPSPLLLASAGALSAVILAVLLEP